MRFVDFMQEATEYVPEIRVLAGLQVVDTVAFTQNGARGTDFDVNNLKLSSKGLEIKNSKTVFSQGTDISNILQHIRSKSLWVLEPPATVAMRIAKMQSRGWKVLNQYP